MRLVDQVHHVLGRHWPDDPRTGWVSGLPAEAGEAQPRGRHALGCFRRERNRSAEARSPRGDHGGLPEFYAVRWSAVSADRR
jgi:hypothetical protein